MTPSFTEIDSQDAALLPARTVMSMFSLGNPSNGGNVSCAVSIGDVAVAVGLLLGSGTATGVGRSC